MQSISPLVGDAGVSIEVFADLGTRAEQMLAQGEEMFSWIPNAYVKYPWESFDIAHELTTKGIHKFVADYQSTLKTLGVVSASPVGDILAVSLQLCPPGVPDAASGP